MEQLNLIPEEVVTELKNHKNAKLPDNTLKMLQILASLDTPKELLATLLEIAEFSIHHIRYLAGPLVIYGNAWSDTIPQWLKFACIQDRLELICNEYQKNQVGDYATATEVLTYMMPATYDAPLHRDYANLYLWVGNEVLTKYNKLPKDCQSFYEFIDGNTSNSGSKSIIHFQQVKNDFHDISQLIQIAVPNYPVVIIDLPAIYKHNNLEHTTGDKRTNISRLLLNKLFCNSALKIAHNAKFEWQFLNQAGLQITGRFFDTQLAYQVFNAGIKTSASLENVTRKLLSIKLDKTLQTSNWHQNLTPEQLQYAALDAAILLDLYPVLVKKLKQANLLKIAQLEFHCMPVVAQMELNGMLFDVCQWHKLGASLEADKINALQQLKQLRLVGKSQLSLLPELTDTVNPNSSQQVLAAFQAMGIPVQSTNQKDLVPLVAQYPIIKALLDYRHFAKITATFTDSLPKHIHPKTGRIHPNYYQLGARSGRFSCRQPPLQTIPRDAAARSCFIAAPNYQILKADYSQIELRIVARLSGDAKMQKAYRQGADLHKLTAALVTGKLITKVTEEDRRLAKAINFGLIYGMGAAKLRIYAETKYGVTMTLEEAKAFRSRFFDAYSGVTKWHETIKKAYLRGVKESRTLAGRRRRWADKPRLAEMLNHPVQGLNADINKLAMVKLVKPLSRTNARLICVVHDEIVLECRENEIEQVSRILHRCMVAAAEKFLNPVPVVVDLSVGDSW